MPWYPRSRRLTLHPPRTERLLQSEWFGIARLCSFQLEYDFVDALFVVFHSCVGLDDPKMESATGILGAGCHEADFQAEFLYLEHRRIARRQALVSRGE